MMDSIYEPATLQGIKQRIDKLSPSSQRQWGTMDVAQMMAHCCVPIEVALGDQEGKGSFFGKLLGPLIKSVITNEKPFKQNLPTDKSFVVADVRDFNKEKQRLTNVLTRLSAGGPGPMHKRRHPFFGKLTSDEWSSSTVKHLDHHLRQFGV
jgi:hypothetical protein